MDGISSFFLFFFSFPFSFRQDPRGFPLGELTRTRGKKLTQKRKTSGREAQWRLWSRLPSPPASAFYFVFFGRSSSFFPPPPARRQGALPAEGALLSQAPRGGRGGRGQAACGGPGRCYPSRREEEERERERWRRKRKRKQPRPRPQRRRRRRSAETTTEPRRRRRHSHPGSLVGLQGPRRPPPLPFLSFLFCDSPLARRRGKGLRRSAKGEAAPFCALGSGGKQ